MKIIKQIDENTRVVLVRFYLPAIWGKVIKLQRKKRNFYKTVSWNYITAFYYGHSDINEIITSLIGLEQNSYTHRKDFLMKEVLKIKH